MANLISDTERQSYVSGINDVVDTFAREITVYQKSAEAVNSSDSNFDAFYDNPRRPNVTYTYQASTVLARIKYLDKQDKEFQLAIASRENQIELTQETQIVRIKIRSNDYTAVNEAERVVVDNKNYKVITSARGHGLFINDYFTFFLQLSNV